MTRTPWALWDLRSGKPTEGASTLEAIEVLETAMQRVEEADTAPHAGMLHMYIHVMEMSSEPEKALRACDALRSWCPMPRTCATCRRTSTCAAVTTTKR